MKHTLWMKAVLSVAGVCAAAGLIGLGQPQPEPAPPAKETAPKQPAPQDGGAKKDAAHPAAPNAGTGGKNDADAGKDAAAAKEKSVLDFKVKTIDGKDADLSQYKGKVVVIVNVASKCGFTSQYEGLETLYKKHKDAGLVVLGFPANNFGKQEPGTEGEIKEFCESKFHVTFPMFAKVSVKGDEVAPLYKMLAAQPKPLGGAPKWNFTKFVVDRRGEVVGRFDAEGLYAGTAVLEPGFVKKVEEELGKK